MSPINTRSVRTRIAPSPTGRMHIGTVRTALFNYLFARKHGGKFILRIEDTDKKRSKEEYARAIFEDFQWIGLQYDEQYKQSEMLSRHKEAMERLINNGSAYVSREESKEEPGREVEVVRLRNPGTNIVFLDAVRGEVSFNTTELGDFVIARSLEEPLYHFAVVVDDAESKITHVIRGEDHISNTPRQILLQEALGFDRPAYAHLPLILAPDRSKLSKRKHNAGVDYFMGKGYLPEAMLNYLALLGWNPGTDNEIFGLDWLVEAFSLEQVQKGGAVFDEAKLKWFNREYLRRRPKEDLERHIEHMLENLYSNSKADAQVLRRAASIICERVSVWDDVREMKAAGEIDFFFSRPEIAVADALVPKKSTKEDTLRHLKYVASVLEGASENFFSSPESIKSRIWDYAEKQGRGAVLWPMRYGLSGLDRSPDPFSIAWVIGKVESVSRLNLSAELLDKAA